MTRITRRVKQPRYGAAAAAATDKSCQYTPIVHYFNSLLTCRTTSRKTSCATSWHVNMLHSMLHDLLLNRTVSGA